MSSSRGTVDYLVEQVASAGAIAARPMFGEYAIYCDGKVVALVCDDQFFLKPTSAGRRVLPNAEQGSPYPAAKPHFLVPAELWDDAERMAELIRVTALELPPPKPRAKLLAQVKRGRKPEN